MAGQTVVVSVLADTAKFNKGMGAVGGGASKFSSGLKTAAKIGIGAFVAGTAAMAIGIAKSIKAAGEYQKLTAQTTAALKSTGGAAGRSAGQIDALTSKLSNMSGVDDNVIRKGENMLLTFKNIKGTNFDKATQSALDMSVAFGQDLSASALQVGKALNDPIQGISALSRVGITFTDTQKAMIKQLVKSGDVAGAQAIMLEEINSNVGASAKAFGITYEGAVGKVKTAFGRLQVSIGDAFLPVMTKLLSKGADLLNKLGNSKGFKDFLGNITGLIGGLGGGDSAIGDFIGNALKLASSLSPFGLVLKAIKPILPQIAAALGSVAGALGGALAAALPSITSLMTTLAGVLSGALVGILPIIVTLITAVVDIVKALLPALMPIIGAVLGVVTAFLPLIPVVAQLIGALLPPLVKLIMALLIPILDLIAPLLSLLAPALIFVAEVLANVITWVTNAITWFVKLVTGSKDAQRDIKRVWDAVLAFFSGIPAAIGRFFSGAINWLRDAGNNVLTGLKRGVDTGWRAVTTFFGSIPSKVMGFVSGAGTWLKDSGRAIIQGFIDGITGMIGAIGDAIGGVMDFAKGFFPNSPAKRGPFSGAGWRQLGKSGKAIGDQFAGGLDKAAGAVDKALNKVVRLPTIDASKIGATASLSLESVGGAAARPAATYNLYISMLEATPEAGRIIMRSIKDYEAAGGRA